MIKFYNQVIINGHLATSTTYGKRLAKMGITPLRQNRYILLKTAKEAITLQAIKIITRPSGRVHRHLARYLIAMSLETGLLWEIFLEEVKGLRGILFNLTQWFQQKQLKQISNNLGINKTLATLRK